RATISQAPAGGEAELYLADGRRAKVPASLLERRPDGTYFVPLRSADLTATRYDSPDAPGNSSSAAAEVERVPVIEERIRVEKERVETGHVRVHIVPQVHKEFVDVDLTDERVEVERVPVGRIVERAEATRQE